MIPFEYDDRHHLRGRWVKNKNCGTEIMVTGFYPSNDEYGEPGEYWISLEGDLRTPQQLFDDYEFVETDGYSYTCGKHK